MFTGPTRFARSSPSGRRSAGSRTWRRPAAGSRPGSATTESPDPPQSTASELPEPRENTSRIDRLRQLVIERADGVLRLNGEPSGRIRLTQGVVDGVDCGSVPGPEILALAPCYPDEEWRELVRVARDPTDPDHRRLVHDLHHDLRRRVAEGQVNELDLELLRRASHADAATTLLWGSTSESDDDLSFEAEKRHWFGTPAPENSSTADTELLRLLDEVRRRATVWAQLRPAVTTRQPLTRLPHLNTSRIRLTAGQWEVARLADGTRTVLDIAWLAGQETLATAVNAFGLIRLNVLAARPENASSTDDGGEQAPVAAARPTDLSFVRAAVPVRG